MTSQRALTVASWRRRSGAASACERSRFNVDDKTHHSAISTFELSIAQMSISRWRLRSFRIWNWNGRALGGLDWLESDEHEEAKLAGNESPAGALALTQSTRARN